MDTKHFTPVNAPSLIPVASSAYVAAARQQAEVLRLEQENARLRHQVSTLEVRLAELRGMVHDFLTATDPV